MCKGFPNNQSKYSIMFTYLHNSDHNQLVYFHKILMAAAGQRETKSHVDNKLSGPDLNCLLLMVLLF